MEIEEEAVSAQSNKKTKKTCNKCSKSVKVHVACFECRNIYHAKCFFQVPTIYVNENGPIFCCQNITSKSNSFESKSQAQENKNGLSVEKGVCRSDSGLENSKFEEEEHKKDEPLHNTRFKKRILEKLNRGRVEFVCALCGSKYLKESSYKWHMKLCGNNYCRVNKTQDADEKLKKVYKCNECSYISKFQSNLKAHSTVHSREKPFRCMLKSCKCSQSRGRSRVKHCDCSVCEYKTAYKGNLRVHILRVHTNKKSKYKCDTCEFKTVYKYNLAMHILETHSGIEKQYKCTDCEFSFHREYNLRRHMITHSNKRPFKCKDCKFSFHRKDHLKRHMIVHSKRKAI